MQGTAAYGHLSMILHIDTKRAAELKDERLYTQGLERPEEDFCPICTLPIQIPTDEHSLFNLYCMKKVCHGCVFASWERAMLDYCPFCRFYMDVSQDVDAPVLALVQKHVDANDPLAIDFLASKYFLGCYLWAREGCAASN